MKISHPNLINLNIFADNNVYSITDYKKSAGTIVLSFLFILKINHMLCISLTFTLHTGIYKSKNWGGQICLLFIYLFIYFYFLLSEYQTENPLNIFKHNLFP